MATKMSSFEEAKTEFESAVVELRDFKERFRMTAMFSSMKACISFKNLSVSLCAINKSYTSLRLALCGLEMPHFRVES